MPSVMIEMMIANAVVMPRNHVPEGTVIGALTYVPPDFPFEPWSAYAGIPVSDRLTVEGAPDKAARPARAKREKGGGRTDTRGKGAKTSTPRKAGGS